MLPQHRGGMRFYRYAVVQYCTFGYLFIALAKTPDKSGQAVTPGGSPRREPGQAVPPAINLSSLARRLSRCGKATEATATRMIIKTY